MSPQQRGIVPPEHAEQLKAARAMLDAAEEAYRTAVAEALKAGASVREVAALTGLSTSTVQKWARDRGWPTTEQKKAAAERRREVDAWTAQLAAAQAILNTMPNPEEDS